jgi:hypothetical protein
MSTTSLFAEILIVGLEALVWIGLLVTAVGGLGWTEHLPSKDWATPATLALLAAAYVLGVLIDRASDSLLSGVDARVRRRLVAPGQPPVNELRLRIMMASNEVTRFIEYIRSRIRIARSTTVNLVLIMLMGVLAALRQPAFAALFGGPAHTLGWLLGLGVPLVVLSTFAWLRISGTFYRHLLTVNRLMSESPTGKARAGDAHSTPARS